MKRYLKIGAALTAVLSISPVFSATAYLETKVARTMTANGEFGDCIFKPTSNASDRGLQCRNEWLTLDCAGELGGKKSSATVMFNEVLLARITERTLSVRIDDQKKINGWCYVDRIQTLPY